jgi:hypothetical protein
VTDELDAIPLHVEQRGRPASGDGDVLAGRVEDYAELRDRGFTIQQAAWRMKLTKRTAERYERLLRQNREG